VTQRKINNTVTTCKPNHNGSCSCSKVYFNMECRSIITVRVIVGMFKLFYKLLIYLTVFIVQTAR